MSSESFKRAQFGKMEAYSTAVSPSGHVTNGHTPLEDQELLHESLLRPLYKEPTTQSSPTVLTTVVKAVLDENTRANKTTLSRGVDIIKKIRHIDPKTEPVDWALDTLEANKKDIEDGMQAREDGPSPLGGHIDIAMDYFDWITHLIYMKRKEHISTLERNLGVGREAVMIGLRLADLIANGIHDKETGEMRENVLKRGNEHFAWISSRKEIKFLYQGLKTASIALMGLNPELSQKFLRASLGVGFIRSLSTVTDPENGKNLSTAGKKIGSVIGVGLDKIFRP